MSRRQRILASGISAEDNRKVELAIKRATDAVVAATDGIEDNAVTNAKLAQMAQATIKGRQSGSGTGDPEDLTATQARTAMGLGAAALQTYAEGTWTPELQFGGAATGITYTTRTGLYTRIGRLIFVECYISLSSKGSATGNSTITGLPVASGTGPERVAILSHGNLSSITDAHVLVGASSSTVIPVQGSRANITDASFADNTWLTFTLFYSV